MIGDFDANDLRIISYIQSGARLSFIASKLGLSVGRISQKITKMEAICGTMLVYRSGGMKLTGAGMILFEMAQKKDQIELEFIQRLDRHKSDHGQLRIIAISSILIDDLPDVLDMVRKEFPHLRIKLTAATADDIIQGVLSGEADVGLVGLSKRVDGLIFSPYKRERICLLTNANHPLATLDEVLFAQAASRHPFIEMDPSSMLSNMMGAASVHGRVIPSYSMRASNAEVAAQMAASSTFGLAFTLENIAKRYAKLHGAKIIYLKDSWASVEVAICTKDIGARTEAQTYFLRKLKAKFQKDD